MRRARSLLTPSTLLSLRLGGTALVVGVVLAGVVLVLGAAGCSLVRGGGSDPPGRATVVRVVDGDTVDVRVGHRPETARLLGLDTPETVDPGAPVGCFGPEASDRTKKLLPAGTAVVLARDVEARDRYGRLLVYLTRVEDDLFVNRSLLADGYARPLSIAPNEAHRAELAAAAAEARAAGRGLWGACSDG